MQCDDRDETVNYAILKCSKSAKEKRKTNMTGWAI